MRLGLMCKLCGSPMVGQHREDGAALGLFRVDGTKGKGSESTHVIVHELLVGQYHFRVKAASVRPAPIGNPTHHGAIPPELRSLEGRRGFYKMGEAFRRGQKNQAAVSQQGVGTQTIFAKAPRDFLQAARPRQRHHLLADFQPRNQEFDHFGERLFLPNDQSAGGSVHRLRRRYSCVGCHIALSSAKFRSDVNGHGDEFLRGAGGRIPLSPVLRGRDKTGNPQPARAASC